MTQTIDTITNTIADRYRSDTAPQSDTDGNDKAASAAPGAIKLSEICFDVEMALRQLELLGFRPGEVPFIRAFPAKGDPRANDIKNSRSNNRSRRFDAKEIERWNREGLGLYLTINAGGSKKADIEECRAIFYEHDDMPKEEQIDLWKSLGLPEPTFQIDTGGRSIHSYWVFVKRIATGDWSYQVDKKWYGLQADLIAHAGADTALVDLPRVMRLAGCWHVTYDVDTHESYATGQTVIIHASGKRYEYEELRAIIPERVPPEPAVSKPVDRNDKATPKRTDSGNDSGNCLDFRKVSNLIPTWNDNARNGWAAFQCPVHTRDGQPHSTDQIQVNHVSGKWEVHCRCRPEEVYAEVCRMVGYVVPKKRSQKRPLFIETPNGSLYPAAGEDKEKAMAWLALPGNEAKARADIAARYEKTGNGNGTVSATTNANSHVSRTPKRDTGGDAPPPGGNDDGNDGGSDGDTEQKQFTQIVHEQLYSDMIWLSCNKKLYHWTGAYYAQTSDAYHRRRINHFADKYYVRDKKGNRTYPYATPYHTQLALKWIKEHFEVKAEELNPPGLNCTNGVLQIEWNVIESVPVPSWRLVPHSPDQYYTYEPLVTYDPTANSDACDRLLSALDAPQLDIFLKTIAASLDLTTVRQYKGRMVRALLLKGDGSNGKDTFREIVSMMYGRHGLTGKSLNDFAAYDDGRKFPLAGIDSARVNWASENSNISRLDNIQSLKAYITGDTLYIERKGKDEFPFKPNGVALFNINDLPNMRAAMEAIKSRYGILLFTKTFKMGADPSKGEIEADPRFKDDPIFLKRDVLPTFLNRVLNALTRLMREGIDYSCTDKALSDIQAQNSHLFQFVRDVGLGYVPNSSITAGELWQRLEQWYIDNGTLSYDDLGNGKRKATWSDQARKGDANVKSVSQVIARFEQLFPKAKRGHRRVENNKLLVTLVGVGFGDPEGSGKATGRQPEGNTEGKNPCCTGDGRHGRQNTVPFAQEGIDFSQSTENDSSKLETETELTLGSEKGIDLPSVPSIPDGAGVDAFPTAFHLPSDQGQTAFRTDQNEPFYLDDDWYAAMDRYYADRYDGSEETQAEQRAEQADWEANIDIYIEQHRQWQIEAIGLEAYEAMSQCDIEIYGGVPTVGKTDGECASSADAGEELSDESADIAVTAQTLANAVFRCGTVWETAALIEGVSDAMLSAARQGLNEEDREIFDALLNEAFEYNAFGKEEAIE